MESEGFTTPNMRTRRPGPVLSQTHTKQMTTEESLILHKPCIIYEFCEPTFLPTYTRSVYSYTHERIGERQD